MKLRAKTAVIFLGVVIPLVVMLYALAMVFLLREFTRIEEDRAHHHMRQALDAIDERIATLKARTADWAHWDETYAFVQGQDPGFPERNLLKDAFLTGLRINYTCFFNREDQLVHAQGYDLTTGEPLDPPQDFLDTLKPGNALLKHASLKSGQGGIILKGKDPLLVTSYPVLTSEHQGAVQGTLIFATEMNEVYRAELGATLGLSLLIHTLAAPQPSADLQTMLGRLSAPRVVKVAVLDQERIASYARLDDIYGNPALALSIESPREIYGQGVKALRTFLLAVLATGLFLGLVSAYLWHFFVLSRLQRLGEEIATVRTGADLSRRVTPTGKDELTAFARQINETLHALESAEHALVDNEARLTAIVQTAVDGIITINDTGILQSFNRAAERIFGYAAAEVIGRNVSMLMPDPHCSQHDGYLAEYRATGVKKLIGSGREMLGKHKDGSVFPLYLAVSEVQLKDAKVFTGIVRDITEPKRYEELLRDLATYDSLTGLMNRRFLLEELEVVLHTAKRYGHALCLCIIDVDDFKQVNDRWGHTAGDEVLSKLGAVIRKEVRLADKAGRLGGDEFCIVFTHTPSCQAFASAERIRQCVQDLVFKTASSEEFRVTITLGLADLPRLDADEKTFLNAADQALYKAKKEGRNRCAIFGA